MTDQRQEPITWPPDAWTRARSERLGIIDAVRGWALLLMILDHVLVLVELEVAAGPWPVTIRTTVTRLALPLFLGCTGYLLAHRRRPPSTARIVQAAGLGTIFSVAGAATGFMAAPDVLVVWALVVSCCWFFALRAPVIALAVGFLCAHYQPIGGLLDHWNGYEPGEVLGWLALGVLAYRSTPARWLHRIPTPGSLLWAAHRPLTVYAGHLTVLYLIWGLS